MVCLRALCDKVCNYHHDKGAAHSPRPTSQRTAPSARAPAEADVVSRTRWCSRPAALSGQASQPWYLPATPSLQLPSLRYQTHVNVWGRHALRGCRPGDQRLQVCPGRGLVAQAGGGEASGPRLQALAPGGGVGGLALHNGHGRAKLRARRAALSPAVSTGRPCACWRPAHRLGRQPVRQGTPRSHTGRRAPGGSPPRRSGHTAAACRPGGTLRCRPRRSALRLRRQPLPPRPRPATARVRRASRPCQRAASDTTALSARRRRSSRCPGGP